MYRLIAAACLAASPAVAQQSIDLTFAAEIGGAPFTCDETYAGLGTGEMPAQVLDYRLFVSNVMLKTADGDSVPLELLEDGAWQAEGVALLDFETGTGSCTNGTQQTNMVVRGTAPEGDYTGVSFDIGVPFDLNHGDPTVAPSPLNVTAMFWNWRGGYKFIKFETTPVMADGMNAMQAEHSEGSHGASHGGSHGGSHGDGASGWFLHLGSTMCQAPSRTEAPTGPCANPNLMPVTLEGFDPLAGTIVIDPAPVLAQVNLAMNTPDTAPGCMSFPNDPDCATVLPRLGLAFNDVEAAGQVLVSAR